MDNQFPVAPSFSEWQANRNKREQGFWGAHAPSRAGFGAPPKRTSYQANQTAQGGKVRDDEGVIASTRGACAPERCVRPPDTYYEQRTRVIVVSILQKFLAQDPRESEGRSAMSTFAQPTNRGRVLVAAFVSVGFLWALALSASPQLHQCLHKDANRLEHNCAVTMIASGNYDHAAHPPLVSVPAPSIHFSTIPALTPQWVESPFLGASIFEHAPPARA